MKCIIAGPRYSDPINKIVYSNYEEVCKAVELSGFKITEVVSGRARGVDTLGEVWAADNWIPVEGKPADWNFYGKKAGPIRNAEMEVYSDAAIILWDGHSKGTSNMIELMKKSGKPYYVHMIETTTSKGPLDDFF